MTTPAATSTVGILIGVSALTGSAVHRLTGSAVVQRLVVAAGLGYVLVTGWAMANLSYDIWGAFVAAPVIVLVSVPLLIRFFGSVDASVTRLAIVGLLAKLAGSIAIYSVTFDAYGSGDANQYHTVGRQLAGDVRAGLAPVSSIVPHGIGTQFVERLTGLIYTVAGSSRLAGFMIFGAISFWGLAAFVKAGLVAVAGIDASRYAALVFFLPSLVFWSSTIGKEAVLMGCLGAASLGLASIVAGRRGPAPLLLLVSGIVGASFVRPHFGAIFTAGAAIALISAAVTGARRGAGSRVKVAVLAGLSLVGLVVVANITLDYLAPVRDGSGESSLNDQVSAIFDRVERQTGIGGSQIDAVAVDGPQDWPIASFRTLTRPLPTEARTLAELLPGLEATFLLVLAAVGWRRLASLPRMLVRSPYVLYAVLCVLMFGVAFSSVTNLGILVRQRSLVVPLLLVPLCLPPRDPSRRGPVGATDVRRADGPRAAPVTPWR